MTLSLRHLIFIAILGSLPGLFAAEAIRPDLRGDMQDVDIDTGDTVVRGNARLVLGDLIVHADEVRYSAKQGMVTAKGSVVLTIGARRVLAEEAAYSVKDGSFRIEKPRLGEFPFYLKGSYADGNRELMKFHDAEAYFLEPGPWAPSLAARTLIYDTKSGGIVSADLARFGVGPVHPLYLPKLNHRIGLSMSSLFTLAGGYRSNLGVFLEPGVRFPFSPEFRLGADLGFYSKRGFMIGPGGDYRMKTGSDGEIQGRFRSGYINDHGNRSVDILGDPVPEDRGYVSWEHHQRLAPGLRVDGALGYWSDSEIVRDFRRREFFPVQVPDSYIEAVYAGSNAFVSLLGRFQPNAYHSVQERLPELRFDLLPFHLAGGIYQRLQASYAWLRDDPPEGGPRLRSERADVAYSLTRNFTPREWFGATALAGARVTQYSRTTPGSDRNDYVRALAEFGFDAHLRASGTFAYRNERWKIDGLRHLVTPRLSYRYIPEAEKGRRYIPLIDRRSFNTYLPQLGLGDIRHIDDLHETNVLRASVENVLQTRDPVYGSRDLASFTLANDFRFVREAGQRKVSETHVDLALMPASWMRFELYQRFKPQTLSLRELNTGLTLHDGDQWSLRLSTHYLRGDIAEYAAEFSYRINEAFTAFARIHYDSQRSRFNERSIGIQQILGRTWVLRYEASTFDGSRREGNFELHVDVRALSF